jgi:hypothetical protein
VVEEVVEMVEAVVVVVSVEVVVGGLHREDVVPSAHWHVTFPAAFVVSVHDDKFGPLSMARIVKSEPSTRSGLNEEADHCD